MTLILTLALGGLIWKIYQQKTTRRNWLQAQRLMQEDNLIKAIEKKTGKALTIELKEMVRLYYQGLSIQKISQKMGMTFDKVRYRFRALAKKWRPITSKSLSHNTNTINKITPKTLISYQ